MAKAPAIRDRIKDLRRVRAGDLLPEPRNWRRHPKAQSDALLGVLREIGYADALLARETPEGLMLIDGHLRASLTPDTLVPVLVLDVTEAEAATILATLDPLAAMAQADKSALDALLRDVSTGEAAVQKMLADLAKQSGLDYGEEPKPDPGSQIDRAEELREKWQTERGQLWLVGKHRLLCGDSTKAEDVARLMDGERAVMLWADPPYSRDYESRGAKGDCVSTGRWAAILSSLAGWTARIGSWYVKLPWYDAVIAVPVLRPKHLIVWAKQGFGLGRGDFRPQHEMLLYGREGGVCNAGADLGDVWTFAVPFRGRMHHVAETPTPLIVQAVEVSSQPGDLVVDPFAGSGTAHVAAEQLDRVCYGMEIEPKYVAVSLQRMADMGLTPKLADA